MIKNSKQYLIIYLLLLICFFCSSNMYCNNNEQVIDTQVEVDIKQDDIVDNEELVIEDNAVLPNNSYDSVEIKEHKINNAAKNVSINTDDIDIKQGEDLLNVYGAPPTMALSLAFWRRLNIGYGNVYTSAIPRQLIFCSYDEWLRKPGDDVSSSFTASQGPTQVFDNVDIVPGGPVRGYDYFVDYHESGIILNVKRDGDIFYIGGYSEGTWDILDSRPAFVYDNPTYAWDAETVKNTFETLVVNNLIGYSFDSNKSNLVRTSELSDIVVFDGIQPFNLSPVDCPLRSNIEEIDLTYVNLQLTTFADLFKDCRYIKKITIGEQNYNSISDFSSMFENCSSLEEVNFVGNNKVKPANLNKTFKGCSSLKIINLLNFDDTNNPTLNETFSNCSSLETIIATNDFNNLPQTATNSFINCNNLMGSNGTLFNSSHIDSDYAIIDGTNNRPGYFSTMDLQINYDPNTGNGLVKEEPATLFENVDVLDQGYLKDGYIFDGYIDQDGRSYKVHDSLQHIRKNYNLQAIWKVKQQTDVNSNNPPPGGGGGNSGGVIHPHEIIIKNGGGNNLLFLATNSNIIIGNPTRYLKNNIDCVQLNDNLFLPKNHLISQKLLASPSEFSQFYNNSQFDGFIKLKKVCVCIDGLYYYYDSNGILFKGIARFNNIYQVDFYADPTLIIKSEPGAFYFSLLNGVLTNQSSHIYGQLIQMYPNGKILEQ